MEYVNPSGAIYFTKVDPMRRPRSKAKLLNLSAASSTIGAAQKSLTQLFIETQLCSHPQGIIALVEMYGDATVDINWRAA